ncbi:2Fe-2S iron-sulfur cluster binding domain-containing protein [Afipia massiliensis]|uniref:2Fe-2S iron-sulfur cluster binding domain-containing protein n=1 Tax=Afipia massiliensis TaxID=211460 RepID=A0A4U6BNU5_9BRAD|nr:2Fe-2S iron-sulfur cluster-binding protein [Afipia massiliensis]TKT72066.1 2Fe-2S iron-sulfur cluster binding domain-containing protein [Afipia massiliensis]
MNQISLNVNGKPVSGPVEPRTHLADFLRESRDLTGTHLGCEHGVCGACTILVDGVPVRSCITFAVACDGADVVTIEGLDDDDITRELREAFKREHALQCGYCTPGMLVSARDLVARSPSPDEQAIRVAMSGNLCRCTGYVGIIRAIKSVITARLAREIAPIVGGGRSAVGPAGSGHASVMVAGAAPARAASSAPQMVSAASKALIDRDWTPQNSFDQNFIVHYPREQVWEMFGRVQDVASCLPGASLIGEPKADHVNGQIRVKVGPISAEFRGQAEIERDEGSYSGKIIGAGSDARSSSSTRGMITYRLVPTSDGRSTEVAVNVGYTLTGMLAQFGRAGIVQDVAARLTAAFVKNLEARLGGKTAADLPAADAGLDAGSLVFSVIAGRLKGLFRRLFGSR